MFVLKFIEFASTFYITIYTPHSSVSSRFYYQPVADTFLVRVGVLTMSTKSEKRVERGSLIECTSLCVMGDWAGRRGTSRRLMSRALRIILHG